MSPSNSGVVDSGKTDSMGSEMKVKPKVVIGVLSVVLVCAYLVMWSGPTQPSSEVEEQEGVKQVAARVTNPDVYVEDDDDKYEVDHEDGRAKPPAGESETKQILPEYSCRCDSSHNCELECCWACDEVPPPPPTFSIDFETTMGKIEVGCEVANAPIGVTRLYELVQLGFFNAGQGTKGMGFFRVVPNFIVQFGIHGNPAASRYWRGQVLQDDPVKLSNTEGTLTFATAGKNTRTTQLFFNFGSNQFLDKQGFSPLCKISSGIVSLKKVNAEYGEKPDQGRIQNQGQSYLDLYSNMDYITGARIRV
eukprot:m.116152 g.116152  ORF g.116152 m.116152 type:complete len:306 (+) comp13597_c1_seq1:53-970(+)